MNKFSVQRICNAKKPYLHQTASTIMFYTKNFIVYILWSLQQRKLLHNRSRQAQIVTPHFKKLDKRKKKASRR